MKILVATTILGLLYLGPTQGQGVEDCPELYPCSCFEESNGATVLDCSYKRMMYMPGINEVQYKVNVTKLWMSGNHIENITSTTFQNAVVKEIDFSENALTSLKTDLGKIFKPLRKHLKKLELRYVKGVKLNSRLSFLQGLEVLEELDLSVNSPLEGMLDIREKVFDALNLRSLKKLVMRSCRIGNIAKGALDGLDNLEHLDITSNLLSAVPEGILGLNNLKTLVMTDNKIKAIGQSAFSTLGQITNIDLSENNIKSIDSDAFAGIKEGTPLEIKLSKNHMEDFPKVAFNGFKSLTSLLIDDCNIKVIPKGAFADSGITNLVLDKNPIDWSQSFGAFDGLEDTLKTLSLRRMGLTSLPNEALRRLSTMENIKASSNNIEYLNSGFFDGINSLKVDLASNRINRGEKDLFNGLSRTIELDLNNNDLTDITFLRNAHACMVHKLNLQGNIRMMCDCDLEKFVSSGHVGFTEGICKSNKTNQYNYFATNKIPDLLIAECGNSSQTTSCSWGDVTPAPTETSVTQGYASGAQNKVLSVFMFLLSLYRVAF